MAFTTIESRAVPFPHPFARDVRGDHGGGHHAGPGERKMSAFGGTFHPRHTGQYGDEALKSPRFFSWVIDGHVLEVAELQGGYTMPEGVFRWEQPAGQRLLSQVEVVEVMGEQQQGRRRRAVPQSLVLFVASAGGLCKRWEFVHPYAPRDGGEQVGCASDFPVT